jgi:hypothetical protein
MGTAASAPTRLKKRVELPIELDRRSPGVRIAVACPHRPPALATASGGLALRVRASVNAMHGYWIFGAAIFLGSLELIALYVEHYDRTERENTVSLATPSSSF